MAIPAPTPAYAQRASAVATYEWRLLTFHEAVSDPSWHRPAGNGIGSMWTAWRLHAPGTTNPASLAEAVPGTRILSHVGAVDILYELGIVGLLLYVTVVAVVVIGGVTAIVRRTAGDPRSVIFGTALVIGATIANASVTTVLMFRPIAGPYWLALGLIVSCGAGAWNGVRSA